MPEECVPIAVKIREAAEQAHISKASLCAKCEKTCPRVAALIEKYTEEYTLVKDNAENLQAEIEALHTQIADLKRQIPRPKPNLLGAGRKKKVTPQIEADVLRLRAEGLSFGDITIAINEVSPVKISRSTAYEIYDKYGREPTTLSSDKSCTS